MTIGNGEESISVKTAQRPQPLMNRQYREALPDNSDQRQILFDGLRHLLPSLRAEADAYLDSSGHLELVCELRHAHTAAPDTLFDGSSIIPIHEFRERISSEAALAYLLAHLTVEALRQSYHRQWSVQDLFGIAPELEAYTWFIPSRKLIKSVNELFCRTILSPLPVQLAGDVYDNSYKSSHE